MSSSTSTSSTDATGSRNGLFKLFKKHRHTSSSTGSSRPSGSNGDGHGISTDHDEKCTFRVGIAEDPNHKFRRTMEDAHTYIYNFADHPDWGYFSIFDGHAGHGTADWCSKNMHILAANYMAKADKEREKEKEKEKGSPGTGITTASSSSSSSPSSSSSSSKSSVCHALYSSFVDADEQIGKLGLRNSGSTAAVAILRWEPETSPVPSPVPVSSTPTNNSNLTVSSTSSTTTGTSSDSSGSLVPHKRVLYVANVGDTRVVLSQGGKALRLTYDHKGSDAHEIKRINNLGGIVVGNRVNGVLAVTRSLGDSSMKEFVSGAPYTTETVLTDRDEFFILACDGLWDVCDDQTAVNLIKDIQDPTIASKKLTEYALSHGSSDNLTCMVVRLVSKVFDEHSSST